MKSRLLNQKRASQATTLVAGLCALSLAWACLGTAANGKEKDPGSPFDPNAIIVADDPTHSGTTVKAAPQQKRGILPNANPEARAEALLKQMTLDEKVAYVGGQGNRIQAIPRLGLPEIMMSDGRLGLRKSGMKSTAYPAETCSAATWNTELMETLGVAFGRDFRVRGFHIALAPWVDIIRDPRGGRGFESFSEDPFLTGKMASAKVQGIQSQGVLATLTCYACNNQETARNFYNAEVDERTLHEIYLPSFKLVIQEAKAGCVMTAFNKVNGERCSENAHINTDILRKEIGFKGILMSDWTAVRDGIGAANGGLDLEMPFGKFMSPEFLKQAIAEGKVSEATIDEKVGRILRTIIAAGFLDREQELPGVPKENIGVKDIPGSPEQALEVAREGIVLLINAGGLLPLNPAKVKTLAVFGANAHPGVVSGGGSSIMSPYHVVSAFDGLKAAFPGCKLVPVAPTIKESGACALGYEGPVKMELFKNRKLEGAPAIVKEVENIDLALGENAPGEGFPAEYSVRWTTKIKAPKDGYYNLAVSSNDGIRVFINGQPVIADWRGHRRELANSGLVKLEGGSTHELKVEYFYGGRAGATLRFAWCPAEVFNKALETARNADAVVLCAGLNYFTEGEGCDRDFALDPFQKALLNTIPGANPNTVVLLFGGAAIDCSEWLEKVSGLLHVWYPGQEGGTAIAEILSGAVNPSGKLPITFPKRIEDHPSYPFFLNKEHMAKNRAVYGEGIFVGYRGYDANSVEPLFPFGFGLSYTSFAYEGLKIKNGADGKVKATFKIKNTGNREGAEIAQLYVAPAKASVPRPPKELKGFAKVRLKPGEAKTVTIELGKDAFAYWNPDKKDWAVEPGHYGILIGTSSRDIRLQAKCEM